MLVIFSVLSYLCQHGRTFVGAMLICFECWWQDIIRLPSLFQFIRRPLAKLISVLRAPKSKEGYAAIGGGSPLRKITDEQVYILHFSYLVLTSSHISLFWQNLFLVYRTLLSFFFFLNNFNYHFFPLEVGVLCAGILWCHFVWMVNYLYFFGLWYLLQAHALKMALEAKNLHANVYIGMRYWYPFTEEAIQQVSPWSLYWN